MHCSNFNSFRFKISSSNVISILLTLAWIIMPALAFAADISLSWARPNDARVAGYNIYYGISGDQYRIEPKIRIESGDQTSVLIQDMLEWQTYDFSMTSMDAEGNESEFSEEITYTVSSEPVESSTSFPADNESDRNRENSAEVNCFIRTLFRIPSI